MARKDGRRGGGKVNQAGGRKGNMMAQSFKSLNSPASDGHMSLLALLEKHRLKQLQQHIAKIKRRKGEPTEKPLVQPVDDGEDTKVVTLEEEDDLKLLLNDDPKLIVGLRAYTRGADGRPIGREVDGVEFCAIHQWVRRERDRYRDLDGRWGRVGEVTSVRKGKYMDYVNVNYETRDPLRRLPAVLKSIMVRLMPHEAKISAAVLTKGALNAAIDRTAAEFASATGCEVITAAAHRMTKTDLHIHIQFTTVLGFLETDSKLGRRKNPWKKKAVEMARQSLREEGVENPGSSAVGARKKRLIAQGKLESEPAAVIEYHKVKGLRSLKNDAILGYSFRHKLNLVRLAEDVGDSDLADRVTRRNDEPGCFRAISRQSDADLEKKYLDVWMERQWRRIVMEALPEAAQEKIRASGAGAAKNYADYGTTLVETFHLKRRILELEKEVYDAELEALFVAYDNEQQRLDAEENRRREQMVADVRAEAEIKTARAEVERIGRELQRVTESTGKQLNASAARIKELECFVTDAENAKESAKRSEAAASRKMVEMEREIGGLRKAVNAATEAINLLQAILDVQEVKKILRRNSLTNLWKRIEEVGSRIGIRLFKRDEKGKESVVAKKPLGPTMED